MWKRQPRRVFVIIEKEALVGVLTPTCNKLDVPILAARGYPSCTVLRDFALEDIIPTIDEQEITILHLGDHDPSGIDMTRDLTERVSLFTRQSVELCASRLPWTKYKSASPPPNPAKTTDSRFQQYMEQFGDESWELDALPPEYLVNLVSRGNSRTYRRGAMGSRRAPRCRRTTPYSQGCGILRVNGAS
jgi:hypothetical protein